MSEAEENVIVSVGSANGGEPDPAPGNEEDVLDQVFDNAERVCCGIGEKKIEPAVSQTNEPLDVEQGEPKENVSEVLTEESLPDDGFAIEEYEQPKQMERDSSKVREAVEIQAHFDGEEDDLTIVSKTGRDISSVGASGFGFADHKKNKQRQRRLGCTLCVLIAALVLLVLVLTISVDKNEDSGTTESGLLSSAGTVTQTDPPTEAEPVSTASPEETEDADAALEEVTGSPTSSPSVEVTTCTNAISVSQGCYQYFQEEIMVDFNICDPVSLDWIGLYPEGLAPNALGNPQFEWNYSCGDRNCEGAVSSGSVNMNRFMPPGRYQAFLFSNSEGDNGAPYSSIAASEAFEISAIECA